MRGIKFPSDASDKQQFQRSQCIGLRAAPLTPEAMSMPIRSAKRSTGKADVSVVIEMYEGIVSTAALDIDVLVF